MHSQGSKSKYVNLFKNSHKIAHKSGKIGGWCSLLVMMLRNISGIEGPCSSLVIYPKIARQSPKKSDQNKGMGCPLPSAFFVQSEAETGMSTH